jgi:hypothetical protein
MTTLSAAITLPEVNYAAVLIGKNLYLYVPRPLDIALEVDSPVTEGRERLLSGGLERDAQLRHISHDGHAASATTR